MTHGEQTPLQLASSLGSSIHCRQLPTLTTLQAAMHFPVPAAHILAGARPQKRVNGIAFITTIHRSCM